MQRCTASGGVCPEPFLMSGFRTKSVRTESLRLGTAYYYFFYISICRVDSGKIKSNTFEHNMVQARISNESNVSEDFQALKY
jgi:hypothetical protein